MQSSGKTGRPRSETTKDAILAAAFAIMIERGYAGLAIDVVAQAAGAGKSTIYRWWKSKAELAVDAFFHATKDALTFPDTGSAKGDFTRQIIELADLLRGPRGTAMAAMLGGALTDPVLAKALGEKWLNSRRQWGFARMSKAKTMGELLPDVDVGAALAVLYGPLYAPLLFGQEIPDAATVERVLAVSTRGIFKSTT